MKKVTILSFVFFCTVLFPPLSRAQTPFGGLDTVMIPCTCSGMAAHLFSPLYINSAASITGYLAAPYTPLMYLNFYLHPGAWALGFYTPAVQPCYMIAYPCVLFPVLGVINTNTGTSP